MNIVKEHINFKRGLDPKEAMVIGQAAMDQKLFDAIKKLPIEDSWIKYIPKATSSSSKRLYNYIKIVLPLYWIMRKTATVELVNLIKDMNAPNVKSVYEDSNGDVVIKLK